MCQVEEEDLDRVAVSEDRAEDPSASQISDISERACVKCGAPAVIHLRDEDVKCGKCLTASVQQKLRAVLAKYQISRRRERVLVAFSGGPASAALLGVLREATAASIYSRLFLVPVVIYIDEGALFSQSEAVRRDVVKSVMETALSVSSTFLCLHSSLEMVFAPPAVPLVTTYGEGKETDRQMEEYREKLERLMKSVKTQTGKEEVGRLLRKFLLEKIGRQLEVAMVFVGDCVDRLAVRLVTNTALGKGKRLPLDLGYVDRQDAPQGSGYGRDGQGSGFGRGGQGCGLMVVRPLKDVTRKEIGVYNEVMGIGSVEVGSGQTDGRIGGGERGGVYAFTEKFIFELQKGFPQTVTTLCRTGDKLCSVTAGKEGVRKGEGGLRCGFCLGPMDSSVIDSCTAENSIALSLRLSALTKRDPVDVGGLGELRDGLSGHRGESVCYEKGDLCGSGSGSGSGSGCCRVEKERDGGKLCYACRWMMSELGDKSLLPDNLAGDAHDRTTKRDEMRETIRDYLLPDSGDEDGDEDEDG